MNIRITWTWNTFSIGGGYFKADYAPGEPKCIIIQIGFLNFIFEE